jgi:hypothetical protein
MMGTDQDRSNYEMEPEDKDAPWELPDRQALSILSGATPLPLPVDGTTAPAPVTDAGAYGAQAGDSAGQLADTAGEASGSGQESVTSEDRSETFTSSDSASAQT